MLKVFWARQEVEGGRLAVQWVPTAKMLADGFTKILPRQKHRDFVHQVGLVDISLELEKDSLIVSQGLPADLTKWQ